MAIVARCLGWNNNNNNNNFNLFKNEKLKGIILIYVLNKIIQINKDLI